MLRRRLHTRTSSNTGTRMKGRLSPVQVATIEAGDDELRRVVATIESTDTFTKLVNAGVVKRRRMAAGQARAQHIYMLAEISQFAAETELDDRLPRWREELQRIHSDAQLREFAARVGAPIGDIRRIVGYAGAVQALMHYEDRSFSWQDAVLEDHAASAVAVLHTARMDQSVELIKRFVGLYKVSLEDFVSDFLQGEREAVAIAASLGADEHELAAVMDAVVTIQAHDLLAEEMSSHSSQRLHHPVPWDRCVGKITVNNSGTPKVTFDPATACSRLYVIDTHRLSEMPEFRQREDVQTVLDQLSAINLRSAVIGRTVLALMHRQAQYLRTGNELDLHPLSQRSIADLTGAHPSTVSRAMRDKQIDTPHGRKMLHDLCPRISSVVAIIAREAPLATAAEIADELNRRHGVERHARTIRYHLAKSRHLAGTR